VLDSLTEAKRATEILARRLRSPSKDALRDVWLWHVDETVQILACWILSARGTKGSPRF